MTKDSLQAPPLLVGGGQSMDDGCIKLESYGPIRNMKIKNIFLSVLALTWE